MTVRVHGFNHDGRLGYFMGDNALASIAVEGAELGATGVIMTLADFKKMYAIDPSKGIAEEVDYKWIDDSNTAQSKKLPNITVEARTILGTVYATDAAYVQAYAKQHNMLRLVDTVQQRSVILGISEGGARAAIVSADVTAGGAHSKWSLALAGSPQSVTLMIERAAVYDRLRPNLYGQPEAAAPKIGKELVDDLLGLKLLSTTATDVELTTTNYSVRIDRNIPQI